MMEAVERNENREGGEALTKGWISVGLSIKSRYWGVYIFVPNGRYFGRSDCTYLFRLTIQSDSIWK